MEEIPDIKKLTKLAMLETIRSKGFSASTSMKKDKLYDYYTRVLKGEVKPKKVSIKKLLAGEKIKSIYPESTVFPITMDREDYIKRLKQLDFEFRLNTPDDIDSIPTIEMRKRLFRIIPDPSDVAESESDSEEDEPVPFEKAAKRIVEGAKSVEAGEARKLYVAQQLVKLPIDQRARFISLMKASQVKKV